MMCTLERLLQNDEFSYWVGVYIDTRVAANLKIDLLIACGKFT